MTHWVNFWKRTTFFSLSQSSNNSIRVATKNVKSFWWKAPLGLTSLVNCQESKLLDSTVVPTALVYTSESTYPDNRENHRTDACQLPDYGHKKVSSTTSFCFRKFLSFGNYSRLRLMDKDVFIALKVNVVEHYNIIANWKRKVGDFLCWSFGWDPKNLSTLE